MKEYNAKLLRALLDIYPDIGLQASKFSRLPGMEIILNIFLELIIVLVNYFHDPKNGRHFLDAFATKRNFDPLIVENWYKIIWADIKREVYILHKVKRINDLLFLQRGLPLLLYYNYSLSGALRSLYPELAFDESKFVFVPSRFNFYLILFIYVFYIYITAFIQNIIMPMLRINVKCAMNMQRNITLIR